MCFRFTYSYFMNCARIHNKMKNSVLEVFSFITYYQEKFQKCINIPIIGNDPNTACVKG